MSPDAREADSPETASDEPSREQHGAARGWSGISWKPPGYDLRVTALILVGGLPAVVVCGVFLWFWERHAYLKLSVFLAIFFCWLLCTIAARDTVVRTLQTLSNILAGLREGDYSIRGRVKKPDDSHGEVMAEVNQLADLLHAQRLGAVEATALLRRVMDVIEVAIFTFDSHGRLRFLNRAGHQLLGKSEEELLGRSAESLGLAGCLAVSGDRTMDLAFPSGSGRWGVSTTIFREEGMQQHLVAIQDLTRALREEEIATWKRLVRVLGHELNNSLAPIISIAGSVQTLVGREPLPEDWREDVVRGLEIIAKRADALSRFMSHYARLAKLPPPVLAPVALAPLVRRVAALETRLPVTVEAGPDVELMADSDQLEQVLINLIRNAVDASLETGGKVTVRWEREQGQVLLRVLDEGMGIANPGNLFVPFFTTKQGGSGIGLVLCRQIAEAHGGSVQLQNRRGRVGCEVALRIPLGPKNGALGH